MGDSFAQHLRKRLLEMFISVGENLLPVMFGSTTGSEVMKRIAAPMVGGLVSSTILTLLIIPAIYYLIKRHSVAADPQQDN